MSTIEKATQSLSFFARKTPGEAFDKMKALKLVYFADRYHLRRYGRPVVGDHYRAWPWGPVPDTCYHAATQRSTLDPWAREYVRRHLTPVTDSDDKVCWIISNAEVDENVFSETDLEALNFAHLRFGHIHGKRLSLLTHAYPEWAKHSRVEITKKSEEMDYLDFFLAPDPVLLRHLGFTESDNPFTEDPRLLELSREDFIQHRTLADLLS